jgi:hypothetical protein
MRRLWPGVVISVGAILLLFGSSVGAAGNQVLLLSGASPKITESSVNVSIPAVNAHPAHGCSLINIFGCAFDLATPPSPAQCDVLMPLTFGIVGPACGYALATSVWQSFATSVQLVTAKNLMTVLFNSLNQTNSEIANTNATVQETLSYFEQRAEAIVPYFIGVPWNQSIADAIVTYSGLIPSIEGMVTSYAYQIYQDYHSLALSWKNIYGPGGAFGGGTYYDALLLNCTGYRGIGANNTNCGTIVRTASGNTEWFNVTTPWETWTGVNPNGSSDTAFFNLAPGGTIICVPVDGSIAPCPTYKVYDLTTGGSATVPVISVPAWQNNTAIPILTNTSHIGQFDLLKLVCASACNATQPYVEVSNGFIFRNASAANPDIFSRFENGTGLYPDTMIPRSFLSSQNPNVAGFGVPSLDFTLCMTTSVSTASTCSTPKVPEAGISRGFGSGPSAVLGGNNSPMRYAQTMQDLVNNTMNAAEVYFITLRTITDNGTYAIPANCAIPFPSDAFPASTQPGNYNLSVVNGLALFWSYLDAVGKVYGSPGVIGLEFCGTPHLGLKFSWSQSWTLATNITASVYLGGPNGTPVYPNGSSDPLAVYSTPATWPVVRVVPTLLLPYEYQTTVPINTIYPIPFNNPMAAVLVNWSGNIGYGTDLAGTPLWGVPTYLSLQGGGNAVWPNGTLSNETSGLTNSSRDAIDISSCVVNSVPRNPCSLSVVYFNTFTYGYQAGLIGPVQPPGGGSGSSGFNGAICGSLFSWIPLIGSYITSFCNLVLGALEIVLIVIILAVAIWVIAKAASARSGGGSSRGGTTINVNAGGRVTRRR